MKARIPVKKYVMNPELPWKERYAELEKHHLEETSALITIIGKLEAELEGRTPPPIAPPEKKPDKSVDFYINGKRFSARLTSVTYDQLVDWAFPDKTKAILYSITFRSGDFYGTMSRGQHAPLVEGAVFNVVYTGGA